MNKTLADIRAILWPDGDENAEWSPDTLDAIASYVREHSALFGAHAYPDAEEDAVCPHGYYWYMRLEDWGPHHPAGTLTTDCAKCGVCLSCNTLVKISDHSTDADCTVGADGCCTQCGVSHTGPGCAVCNGKGFHNGDCERADVHQRCAPHV